MAERLTECVRQEANGACQRDERIDFHIWPIAGLSKNIRAEPEDLMSSIPVNSLLSNSWQCFFFFFFFLTTYCSRLPSGQAGAAPGRRRSRSRHGGSRGVISFERSQSRTVASAPPEAKVWPSGAKATDRIPFERQRRVARSWPRPTSRSVKHAPELFQARVRLSGANASAVIHPEPFGRAARGRLVAVFHKVMPPFKLPEASALPSGRKTKE